MVGSSQARAALRAAAKRIIAAAGADASCRQSAVVPAGRMPYNRRLEIISGGKDFS
jgi:hypothetical protein